MYFAQTTKNRIKLLCKEKKVSMEDMLSECSLGINAVRQINDTKGMASFSLAKIADYLDCSVDYLLGRTDCPDLMVKDKEGNTSFIQLKRSQNVYKAKIAASDGSFNKEVTLTDSDLEKLGALPDVDDI